MKIFTCSSCKHVAFFENSQCTRCGHTLAYLSDRGVLSALEQDTTSEAGAGYYRALDPLAQGRRYRLCGNYTKHMVCNWAIPEHDTNEFCLACRLNESTPDLSDPSALPSWQGLEIAKRRLVYTLLELGLPLDTKLEQPQTGLAFAFKSDGINGEKVLTGHCDGVVTINMKEADSPSREQTRVAMGERYRTLLGHFRHESGHYYWDRLVKDGPQLEGYRALFGNEQEDYAEAVNRHYASPKQNWADEYVSAYATMHPWEDWAETWAHYLHMIDTLETAQSFGLALKPQPVGGATAEPVSAGRVHFERFDDLIEAWVPLTVALNSLNRSMGLADVYPFVLAERVVAKLKFVHDVVERAGNGMSSNIAPDVQRAAATRAQDAA
ncbi:MAG TPA: putative zinc-binding peptidase [Polyangiaceae bacterium]|nr:putative zinc-binding peptidase [Polyangiaceae bacterium]